MEPVVLDAAGRRRSPATLPGHGVGRPPRNKGLRYPADPPSIEEIVCAMRCAGPRVSDGESWKSKPAFDVAWKNPPQAFAPVAGVEYTLCPAPPAAASCVPGSKDAAGVESLGGVEVPQPGDWLLTTWLRDEAGNAAPETAAPPVHLRFDPTPPQVACGCARR